MLEVELGLLAAWWLLAVSQTALVGGASLLVRSVVTGGSREIKLPSLAVDLSVYGAQAQIHSCESGDQGNENRKKASGKTGGWGDEGMGGGPGGHCGGHAVDVSA